ncbi:5-formyltetrahydrofolate cyclo-ligase [Cryptosporangium aurantiacum]|uniref:5-formyltetrahydrofolate cyclo-ligase n=1 Tax=Cryptosporangium aurantiacum TaxID=134849 RepID=A0A1M7RJG8_9ACTN|nr:5-formyltetrahydrofolate cyclo-ligase [Cryptosporangium aurantiacum]SHN46414.1 5-formyltetrahydrofolate cyclo-ligase [Cryptosporangium aurantiacum]
MSATYASASPDGPVRSAKASLRAARRSARAARFGSLSPAEVAVESRRLVAHLLAGLNERGVWSVAAYLPVGSEPGVVPGPPTLSGAPRVGLPDALREAGIGVLLPLMRPDRDLDWAPYEGRESLVRGPHDLWEPDPASTLGVDAVRSADVVVVPALAVGRDGSRLGRGAGCYDRALARVAPATPLVALVYDDELLDAVPTEPHDRPVTDVVTPTGGWLPLSSRGHHL